MIQNSCPCEYRYSDPGVSENAGVATSGVLCILWFEGKHRAAEVLGQKRPLRRSGTLLFVTGPNAGQSFGVNATYSYCWDVGAGVVTLTSDLLERAGCRNQIIKCREEGGRAGG